MTYVVIAGDPVDGFNLYGPFDDRDDAVSWAEADDWDCEWWIAEVTRP